MARTMQLRLLPGPCGCRIIRPVTNGEKKEAPKTRLREERERRGLTVREVAESVGYDPSNLSRVELGQQLVPREVARALYRLYRGRVPLGEIYDPLFRFEVAPLRRARAVA